MITEHMRTNLLPLSGLPPPSPSQEAQPVPAGHKPPSDGPEDTSKDKGDQAQQIAALAAQLQQLQVGYWTYVGVFVYMLWGSGKTRNDGNGNGNRNGKGLAQVSSVDDTN